MSWECEDATYKEMLKVAAEVEREEAEQKRQEEQAAKEQEEKYLYEMVADLGDLFEE